MQLCALATPRAVPVWEQDRCGKPGDFLGRDPDGVVPSSTMLLILFFALLFVPLLCRHGVRLVVDAPPPHHQPRFFFFVLLLLSLPLPLPRFGRPVACDYRFGSRFVSALFASAGLAWVRLVGLSVCPA